jgi:hypothetical protein
MHKQITISKAYQPCKHCNNLHRNKKDNYCNNCRGGILKFGIHKEKSLRYVLDNDNGYCEWASKIDRLILYNPFTQEDVESKNFFELKNWLKDKFLKNTAGSARCLTTEGLRTEI